MKKAVIAIFAFLYLGLSSGAVVHLHFCMDKLVEWNLLQDRDSGRCDNCGMSLKETKNSKDCCREDIKIIKITDNQKTVSDPNTTLHFLSHTTAANFPGLTEIFIPAVTEKKFVYYPPPLSNEREAYLINCNFRI